MIAVDTNILVYAHREDAPFHAAALRRVTELAENRSAWAIPWPCIHDFFSVVTNPRIYGVPTPISLAIDAVMAWMEAPGLTLLAEADGYWRQLQSILTAGRIMGAQVHDARIAALCRLHGVRELWSADRDFSRFPDLKIVNPLTD